MITRNLSSIKRVVIKVGTNLISNETGISTEKIRDIVKGIIDLRDKGISVLLVTSGAVGLGAKELNLKTAIKTTLMRQTCASIGQPILMSHYRQAFSTYNAICAQVLITKTELNDRKTFLNLRNSVTSLLDHGVIPIFNENDTVSTDEVGTAVGDNDRLSAFVASKIDADLLILLTDIDGLYDKNPKEYLDAHIIHEVEAITDEIMQSAGVAGSLYSTGGMKTKLLAARIASYAGCATVIASGYEADILPSIINGKRVGTYFAPLKRLNQRPRWILNSAPRGTIWIDEGAINALKSHKSLLASGITGVDGAFEAGEVVMINTIAKAVPYFNSTEIIEKVGQHKTHTSKKGRGDVIFRPEDIMFIDNL